MTTVSRRHFIQHAIGCCACGFAAVDALARIPPAQMSALVGPDYQPTAADERGLWEQFDRLEQEIAVSNLLIRDPALTKYLEGVTRNLIGDLVADLRIYPVRNPDFNASMAPNGMMLVHSGLLARVRNEAQLAAVLGHECGHYLRLHSVSRWRDIRAKTSVAAFVQVAGDVATGATGTNWYDIANTLANGLLLSIFSFTRTQESEADAYGVKVLHRAGYAPHAASEVWSQLIQERKASAAARKKRYKDRANSAVSTHPPSSDRMVDLKASAMDMEGRDPVDSRYNSGREEYLAAIAPLRQTLLDEQVRLNDPGASLFLVNSLAQDGWDGVLRYNEGEIYRLRDEQGDASRALSAYAAAVEHSNAPAEAHRAHGYALLKAGDRAGGRAALARYLELKPDATDAAMVRFSIGS